MTDVLISEVVNLTGHELTLLSPFGNAVLPSEGRAMMDSDMSMVDRVTWRVDGYNAAIPLLSVREKGVVGLPEPYQEPTRLYVVSGLVAASVARDDVVSPGRLQRDRHGKVIGAAALVRVSRL